MPAAIAVPALISAGSSIASGVLGSRAANGAAATQSAAAQAAAAQYNQAAQAAGQQMLDTAGSAGQQVTQAADLAGQNLIGAAGAGAGQITDATQAGIAGSQQAVGSANDLLRYLYGRATDATSPYAQAGTGAVNSLAALLSPGGEMMQQFRFDPDSDPGYQFRLQEGQRALERSAAARGGLQGGGTLKALQRYAQGIASDEYQKSFERFQGDRKARFGMLSDLAGFGQRAVAQQLDAANAFGSGASGNLTRGAEYQGQLGLRGAESASDLNFRGTQQAGGWNTAAANAAANAQMQAARAAGDWRTDGARGAGEALMGGANAQAAGRIGSANAWSSTIGNVGRTAADAFGKRRGQAPRTAGTSGGGSSLPAIPGYNPQTGRYQ